MVNASESQLQKLMLQEAEQNWMDYGFLPSKLPTWTPESHQVPFPST